MSVRKFILFDFDGVIADSFAQALAVNRMRCAHLTEEEYREKFSGNINEWNRNRANTRTPHTPECRLDIDFFTEYLPKFKKEVGMFSGMREVIEDFARNYTLIVISSTLSAPIAEFAESQGIGRCFTEIMGNDVHESKVHKIDMVFSKYGVGARDCVFITDTLGDMKEAAHHNVGSIGVAWGFQAEETLLEGKPFRVVKRPDGLPRAVLEYFDSRK